MRASLEEIRTFSQCPAKYWFSKKELLLRSTRKVIIEDVIQRAHQRAMETGYRATWKEILSWVDSYVFKDVDPKNREQLQAARSLAGQLLSGLQQWYSKLYIKENYPVYPHINLAVEIGSHIAIGEISVIQAATMPILSTFADISTTRMYNDLYIRGLAYLAMTELSSNTSLIRRFEVGNQGKLKWYEIKIRRASSMRTEIALHQVLSTIQAGITYPSVSEQCSNCLYKGGCRL